MAWYDAHAARYIARTDSFRYFRGLEQDLARFVELLQSDAVVVDLGSGGGRDARWIARLGYTVVAVDASLALLRQCLVGAAPTRRVLGVNADLSALPFAANSIGGVWACGSLLHLPRASIPAVIDRCREILRPGAPIGLSMKEGRGAERRDDGRLFTYTSKQEVHDWLASAGFESVTVRGPARNEWLLALAISPRSV
ncbi:class I SAM-dependent methyltransferase [Nocardia sp. N2S4-5]|uniref:class I SAM-dependent methyltransferase n=1 Tax=Nocardia sp. N2S4-5 TaxID=3351565 RepID=UPI0037D482CE